MTLFDHEVLGHHVIVFGVLSGWTVTAEVLGIMCCLGSVIGWGRGGAADLATSSELERAMAWKVKTEPEKNKQTRTHPVWYSEHRPCQARFCLGTRWQVFGTSACRDSGPAGCFLAAGVIIYIYIPSPNHSMSFQCFLQPVGERLLAPRVQRTRGHKAPCDPSKAERFASHVGACLHC